MKKLSKTIIIFFAFIALHMGANAQLRPGSVIIGFFEASVKNTYVAYVLSVNGNQFTCRFSSSNTEYVFSTDNNLEAVVISSKGGKYAKGSRFLFVEYRISDKTYQCILQKIPNTAVIVKFADGKTFLGNLTSEFTVYGGYQVMFWHSNSRYNFDKDGVVLSQKGGAYPKGTITKIYCAEMAGPAPVGMVLPNATE